MKEGKSNLGFLPPREKAAESDESDDSGFDFAKKREPVKIKA